MGDIPRSQTGNVQENRRVKIRRFFAPVSHFMNIRELFTRDTPRFYAEYRHFTANNIQYCEYFCIIRRELPRILHFIFCIPPILPRFSSHYSFYLLYYSQFYSLNFAILRIKIPVFSRRGLLLNFALYSRKSLIKSVNQIGNIFYSDRQSYGVRLDSLLQKLLLIELRMCRRSGVNYK